jgi:hypothetical protein
MHQLTATNLGSSSRAIGRVGTAVRALLGGALVALAFFPQPPLWWRVVLGLVGFPLALLAWVALRARWWPEPLQASSPAACLALAASVAPLLFGPTRPAGLLFLGVSLLVAAGSGHANCEITAIGNWALRPHDQATCPVLTPIDRLEHHAAVGGRD